MRKKNIFLQYLGIVLLIITYTIIFFKPSHEGLGFMKDRITFSGLETTEISKDKMDSIIDNEFGLKYNFNSSAQYQLKDTNNKNSFIILEYNDAMKATDAQSKFQDFVKDSKKSQKSIDIPDFKDFRKINDQVLNLKKEINKISNFRDNFNFGANSNFLVIQIKGNSDVFNKIVRVIN